MDELNWSEAHPFLDTMVGTSKLRSDSVQRDQAEQAIPRFASATVQETYRVWLGYIARVQSV